MAIGTYFLRPCPTCGRRLEIQVRHLGRTVLCPHCRAAFLASQESRLDLQRDAVAEALLQAERFLERAESERQARVDWRSSGEEEEAGVMFDLSSLDSPRSAR